MSAFIKTGEVLLLSSFNEKSCEREWLGADQSISPCSFNGSLMQPCLDGLGDGVRGGTSEVALMARWKKWQFVLFTASFLLLLLSLLTNDKMIIILIKRFICVAYFQRVKHGIGWCSGVAVNLYSMTNLLRLLIDLLLLDKPQDICMCERNFFTVMRHIWLISAQLMRNLIQNLWRAVVCQSLMDHSW